MKDIKDITDEDIKLNAIGFALSRCSRKEGEDYNIEKPDFHKTKQTFIICATYLRDKFQEASKDSITFTEASL